VFSNVGGHGPSAIASTRAMLGHRRLELGPERDIEAAGAGRQGRKGARTCVAGSNRRMARHPMRRRAEDVLRRGGR